MSERIAPLAAPGEAAPGGYSIVPFDRLMAAQQMQYEHAMRRLLEPFYGNQDEALAKIRHGNDRTAEVVLEDKGLPCATLVYKNDLQTEAHWDDRNGDTIITADAFEIKTLAVLDPETHSNRGIGSQLVRRAEVLARERSAKGIMIVVGVSLGNLKDNFFCIDNSYSLGLFKTNKTSLGSGYLLYKALEPGGLDKSGRWFS